jgi:hypothetical protein
MTSVVCLCRILPSSPPRHPTTPTPSTPCARHYGPPPPLAPAHTPGRTQVAPQSSRSPSSDARRAARDRSNEAVSNVIKHNLCVSMKLRLARRFKIQSDSFWPHQGSLYTNLINRAVTARGSHSMPDVVRASSPHLTSPHPTPPHPTPPHPAPPHPTPPHLTSLHLA